MIPLVVNTPDPMARFRVMTTKDYSTKTLKTLHSAGVLHVEQSEELKPVDREAIEQERRKIDELLRSINDILSYMPKGERVSLREDVEVIYARPLDEIESELRLLRTKLGNMHHRAARLNEEIKELKEISKYVGPLEQQANIKLRDLNFSGGYLFAQAFVFPRESFEALYPRLKDYILGNLLGTVENETVVYAIAKVNDREAIESLAKEGGGRILRTPEEDLTLREFSGVASDRIYNLERELTSLNIEIESKTRENLEKLVLSREALSAETERLAVLAKACEAEYVTLIEGWIPEINIETTIAQLKDNIGYVFIDTRKPEQAEEPPSKMRNAAPVKPFESIVSLFGIPKYREWDPTPIIAYSFAFFFGLMLCDVVYSLGLMLAVRFGLRRFVDDPESEGFKLFQRVVYIGSGVGLVLGLLSGNYLGNIYTLFGFESLALSPRIGTVLGNPMLFILFAIIIGLVHVNIAHLLATVKGIKERQGKVILGKMGLFILEIAGIPLIIHFIFDLDIPLLTAQMYPILLYAVVGSIVCITVSSIMLNGFLGAILWLFDVTGLLGDVMSYCRLAGVGMATYYLAMSFNLMASILPDLMPAAIRAIVGPLLAVAILVIGHAINLVLGGIACFAHSLRLCFVEFLLKFYEGTGREYSPFRLRKRTLLPVGGKA